MCDRFATIYVEICRFAKNGEKTISCCNVDMQRNVEFKLFSEANPDIETVRQIKCRKIKGFRG